jgi:hypothetical protein
MRHFYLLLSFSCLSLHLFSCSKSEESNTPSGQNIQLKIDGTTKTFQIQASKINGVISVVGSSTSTSRTTVTDEISFTASEDDSITEISNFSYTANGITYTADNAFSSNLIQHSNGKLKGTLMGIVREPNGTTKTITDCNFDFTYEMGTTESSDINNSLHMSFTTPDWSRFIPCDLLDLYPDTIDASTNYVSATSQSTNETFVFSIPADSSAMVLPSNLKKYTIRNYFENQAPFEFSQKLPIQSGSSTKLLSKEGLSASSYNEVASITYVGNESDYCVFKVKCRYKMLTYELNNPSNIKLVTGTFHLKVRTSKN